MDTVCELPTASVTADVVLPEPAEVAGEAMDTVGEMPPPARGGVRRLKSSASIRGKQPSRSNSIQRTASMRAQRPGAPTASASARGGRGVRRVPSRNYSSQSLRPYSGHANGLQRGESEISLGDISSGSAFTLDSVALRKGQLVADPLENGGTYCEEDSYADHESFMTRDDFGLISETEGPGNNMVAMSDLVDLKMRQAIPEGSGDLVEDDTVSFMTGTSALTNDFTNDESEYEATETDYAE